MQWTDLLDDMTPRALIPIILSATLGCGDEILPPPASRLVAIRIVAEPARDTIRLYDSVALRIVADTGPAPVQVAWSIPSRDHGAEAETFVYRPAAPGVELVRAVARFENGASGVAERTLITRSNTPPLIAIVPGTDDDFFRVPLGTTVDLVALVSDPDSDTIPPDDMHWLRNVDGLTTLMATGETFRFSPDSAVTYVLELRVADPAGAVAIARYFSTAYDPITPARWRAHVSPRAVSQVPGGAIVVYDGTAVAAFDRAGGKRWEYPTTAVVPLPVGPAGDIYVAAGALRSIAATGETNWSLAPDVEGRGALFGPAVLQDGALVVPIGGRPAGLRRVTPDGAVQWTTTLDGLIAPRRIAVGRDTTIFVAGDTGQSGRWNGVYAVRPDGTVRWHTVLSTLTTHPAALVVADDSTLLFRSDSLYAIDTSGTVRWATEPLALPVVGTGLLYGFAGGLLHAVSIADGAERWRAPYPVDATLTVPLLTADGQVIVGTGLLAISYHAMNGTELWRHEFAGHVNVDPLLTDEGLLVYGDRLGYLEGIDIGVGPLDAPWPMAWADAQRSARGRLP